MEITIVRVLVKDPTNIGEFRRASPVVGRMVPSMFSASESLDVQGEVPPLGREPLHIGLRWPCAQRGLLRAGLVFEKNTSRERGRRSAPPTLVESLSPLKR
jgi:hypothetical protein